jgi:hypothetical protein
MLQDIILEKYIQKVYRELIGFQNYILNIF